jgi:ferredoxin
MCIAFAPGAFELGVDGITVFRPDGTWTLEQLEEAVDNCPTETLTLVLDEGQGTG